MEYTIEDIVAAANYGFNYCKTSQHGEELPTGNVLQWFIKEKGLSNVPEDFKQFGISTEEQQHKITVLLRYKDAILLIDHPTDTNTFDYSVIEYYYNTHSCPVNYLGYWVYDAKNKDFDPHGMFEVVGVIPYLDPKEYGDIEPGDDIILRRYFRKFHFTSKDARVTVQCFNAERALQEYKNSGAFFEPYLQTSEECTEPDNFEIRTDIDFDYPNLLQHPEAILTKKKKYIQDHKWGI